MVYKKIRIIGTSGSGKTTLARDLSKKYNIPSFDLDDVYFLNKYDIKRDREARKQLLQEITDKDTWIIEGVYVSEWVNDSFEQADIIIYCFAGKFSLIYRLLIRELKKGHSIKNTIGLIRYSLNYKSVSEELTGVLEKHKNKIHYINTSKHINIDKI